MPRAKYPLDPLVRLRDAQVDDQADALARAARDREAKEAARVQADEARQRAAAAAAAKRSEEAEALLRGVLRVADLARADAWEHRVASEDGELRTRLERAAEAEAAAIDTESEARRELAEKKRSAEVVHEHETRWRAHAKRDEEAREEGEAEEAWRRK